MPAVTPDSTETRGLLERIGRQDRSALEWLLQRFRPGLHAFVDSHLDSRVRQRVDPSDIVQETQLEVVRRMISSSSSRLVRPASAPSAPGSIARPSA